MFCQQCGTQVNEGASFCIHCGAKLQTPMQPPISREPDPQPSTPESAAPYQVPAQPFYYTPCPPQPEQPPISRESDPQPSAPESAAPYQAPAQPFYYTPCPPQPEQPPKKPFNKKKLVISLVSILLCLSLVAGIFVYFTYYATAERALRNAAEDTADSLKDLLNKNTELNEVLEALDDIDDEFTVTLTAADSSLSAAFSGEDELLSLKAGTGEQSAHIAIDNEKLVIAFPGIMEEAYSIPLADFGTMLLNSDLGAQIPSEARAILGSMEFRFFDLPSLDSLEDQDFYQEYEESLQLEEVDQTIPHSKGVETVYRFRQSLDDSMDYGMDCIKYMLKPVLGDQLVSLLAYGMTAGAMNADGSSTVLYGLNGDDQLVAVHMITETEGETADVTILLMGKKNPWEQIEFYSDGELQGTVYIKEESDGISIYANEERIVQIDEDTLTLTADGEDIKINYEVRNGGCYFSIEAEDSCIELTILPTCKDKMPTGQIVDLFSLSIAQLEALAERLSGIFG